MKRCYCYLYLTCGKGDEERIAKKLLEKRLVACAKFLPVEAMFWWQGKIDRAKETLMVFESAEDLFGEIEHELESLHPYETFVLTQVRMTNVSSKAAKWLELNLRPYTHRMRET